MQFRKIVIIATLIVASVIALHASGSNEANALNFALSGNPDSLDPHATTGTLTFQVLRSIYDTLVEPDENGVLIPALAESYSVSDDSLRWTFSLRRGVRFHNGDLLTSADVRATIERILAPETASPHTREYSVIDKILTPDEWTVVFVLSEPHAPLISTLASGWGAILPKSLIDSGHDFASVAVGTGPFMLREWKRDTRILLEKNPNYWLSGHPKVDMVVMNIVIERAVAVQALVAGQLDAIYNVNAEDVPILRENEDVRLTRNLTALVMVMAINTSRPPLDNLLVRQALNHAIDKQTVLDIAYGGGEVVGTFMDYGDPYYVDYSNLYPYDPGKAESLLAQAGIGEVVIEMSLPQNFEPHVRAGELYQEMLEKVGFAVELKLVDWPTWIADIFRGGNYDLTVIGHTGKLDPDGRLSGYGIPETYVRWENAQVANLIEAGSRISDPAERKRIYAEVLEIMAIEVPFVFVGSSYRYVATRNNVSGFRMDTKLDSFDFRYVQKLE